MLVETLLQKVFKHKLGNHLTDTQALKLSQDILKDAGMKGLKVGELLAKKSYDSAVKPSSTTATGKLHKDSYEVFTQRISNAYNNLIRQPEGCKVITACIEFDSTTLLKDTVTAKYTGVVQAIIQTNGDFDKILKDNKGADYVKDKDAAEFLFLMYTSIDNSKGMEVSNEAFQRGINKTLGIVANGKLTSSMKVENGRLKRASGNNPLMGHILDNDPNLYSAYINTLFASTEFKHVEISKDREGPNYRSLSHMKTYYTRQFSGVNIPDNHRLILKNPDTKLSSGSLHNKLGVSLEIKTENSPSLKGKGGKTFQADQFNEIYRGKFSPKSLNMELEDKGVNDKKLRSLVQENLKKLDIFGKSEYNGRIVNNLDSLTATLTGGHGESVTMIKNFLTALERSVSGKGAVTSRIDGKTMDLKFGNFSVKDFNQFFSREILHIIDSTSKRNSILDNLKTIIGQTVGSFADSLSDTDILELN